MEHYSTTRLCLRLRIYITTEAGFRFQTEFKFKTEVNLSIGLKPYYRV